MRKIPADKKYTDGHLWFQSITDDTGIIGITDYIQARIGDLIAIELPREGSSFAAHDVMAYIEGILEPMELSAFSNLEILEVNPKLEIHPDVVNRAPYTDGWIFKVRLKGVPRWLDAPGYADFLSGGIVTEGA